MGEVPFQDGVVVGGDDVPPADHAEKFLPVLGIDDRKDIDIPETELFHHGFQIILGGYRGDVGIGQVARDNKFLEVFLKERFLEVLKR
jgi:hypothetical protein